MPNYQRQSHAFPLAAIHFFVLLAATPLTYSTRAQTPPPVAAPTPSVASSPNPSPLPYTGVNLAGGDFNAPKPGERSIYGKNYIYPATSELDYFARRGVNIIRFPFLWERLQPVLDGPLDPADLARVENVVKEATSRGLTVILDPHNYARYHGTLIGTPEVPDAAFADFWGKLADRFRDNPQVWFGLVNEPYDVSAEHWLTTANAAIAAIRQTGATNLILVPGTFWSGAHRWIASGNGAAMTGVKDPVHHYIFEAHQYLDEGSSGTKPETVSATIGSERLKEFTLWCREHHEKALLGEFAAGNTETGARAIDDILVFMENNPDVWVGYTWWAAGPWWGDYMFSVEPKNGADAPLLRLLVPHLQPAPGVTP